MNIYIIIIIVFILFIYTKSSRENYDPGNRFNAPKEILNGCDIYGCNSQGDIKLKTFDPNINKSKTDFPHDIQLKETKLSNYYPETNEIELNYYNGSNIMISSGLSVIKENVREAIDIANSDINILDNNKFNNLKRKITNYNISDRNPIYTSEKHQNIIPFVTYLLKLINSLGNGFHILEFINLENIKKSSIEDQIRLNFDIITRYKFNSNDKYMILFNTKKIIDSLKNLILRTEIFITKHNKQTYIYVNYMYLVGYQEILPKSN